MLSYLIKQSLVSFFLAASATVSPATTTPTVVVQEPPLVTQECADKACVTDLIRRYARYYGVDEDYALAIAKCESEFKTTAIGDGGRARGVYQFHKPTFHEFAKKMGESNLSYEDTEDNIKVAMWAFAHDKDHHWTCSKKVAVM